MTASPRNRKGRYGTSSTPGPFDAIVIGSGMGGMTTAALLSHCGRRVLVLEQHHVPGGFTHTFARKRWRWDVGVHAVGEVTDHALAGRLLHRMTGDALRFEPLESPYDIFELPDGFHFGLPSTRDELRDTLASRFPRERRAIDRYLQEVREAVAAMRGLYGVRVLPPWSRGVEPLLARRARKVGATRTAEVLARLTADRRLRAVLTAQWGYYGSPPSRSSFAAHAMVARHFEFGGYYPRGGAERIAEALLTPVVAAGGAVRVRADVERILIERGRATGVRLANGEELRAPRVVSAAGALATVGRLLPEEERRRPWAREIAALPPSPSHLCLYLGFRGDIRAAGAGAANRWFYETWDHDLAARGDSTSAPVLYVSFPSLKDPEHDPGPEQLHTGEVVTFIAPERFAPWRQTRWRRRGPEYEAFKQELTELLLQQLLGRMPGLRPLVAHAELSTPLSTEHFSRSPGGAIYGLAATPERFACRWLRPRTPVPGLYLSGCDVALGGVIGAMMGGVLAAAAMEPLRCLRFAGPVIAG